MHRTTSLIFVILVTIFLHIKALLVSSSILCDEVLRSDSVDSVYGWNFTKCQLHSYGSPDVVECFDNYAKHLNSSTGKPLHFAFVGDSRIRQAFHSFWPVKHFISFTEGKFLKMIFVDVAKLRPKAE